MTAHAPTPTTLLSGPLGIGKTTAIRHLFGHRPPGARWSVLVNEFGAVGLDGPTFEADGIAVREVAGGCICCATGPMLGVALARLLREQRPDRLIIEPSGLAEPAAVLDLLRAPGIAEAVALRATITLVDPRTVAARYEEDALAQGQVDAADVLVASRADLATDTQIEAFRAWAASRWPAPLAVGVMQHGQLDPAWLDLDPRPAAGHWRVRPAEMPQAFGWGAVWPPEVVFDRARLISTVKGLVDGRAGVDGLLRLKGIFRDNRGWRALNVADDLVRSEPSAHRRDSRVELIFASDDPRRDAILTSIFSAAQIGAIPSPFLQGT